MKITGTGRSETQAMRRKARSAARSGQKFSVSDTAAANSKQPSRDVSDAGAVAPISALLSVQEVADGDSKPHQEIQHADEMLKLLDEIRHGLLTGSVPTERLRRLSHLANSARDQFADPRLTGILSEIELRAKVELAKLEKLTGTL